VARSTGYKETRVHVTSDAVYAQVEGHVTSQLDLVAGYRITKDKKEGVDNSAQDATGTSITCARTWRCFASSTAICSSRPQA